MPPTVDKPTIRPARDALLAASGQLAAAVIGIVGLWCVYDAQRRADLRDSLVQIATAAAAVVDGDLHEQLRTPEQMDGADYQRCIAPLRRIHAQLPNVKFLYTMVLDGDKVRFVLDTATPGDRDGDGVEDRSALWSVYDEADEGLFHALRTGCPITDEQPYPDRWGSFVSGHAPIRDSHGRVVGAIGVDLSAANYLAHLAAARRWALLGVLPAVAVSLLGGFVTYRLRRRTQGDVARYDRQEHALEHERRNLKEIFDAVDVGMLLIDEHGEVCRANHVAVQLVGASADALLRRPAGCALGCAHALHSHGRCGRTSNCPACPLRDAITRVLRTRASVHNVEFEHTVLADRGERRAWLALSATSVVLDDQPFALLVVADVTERKRNEEEVRASEARLKTIMDALQAGVLLVDGATHTIADVNPAALAMFGAAREEVIGQMCHRFVCPANEGCCPVTDLGEGVANAERTVLTADGRRVPVLKTVVPVTLKGQEYLLESFVDISDRKRAEEELAAHRAQLEELVRERTQKLLAAERQVLQGEKLASIGRLAAGVAHEINTPIQYIGDNLRALADFHEDLRVLVGQYRELVRLVAQTGAPPALVTDVLAAEEERDLDFILEDAPKAVSQGLEGVQRVADIVRAMKDFSHLRRSEVSSVDLNRCLQSTLTVAHNEYKYFADLETDFGELPNVECYAGELNQVFLNILVNAAHAVQDTGRRGKITVRTRHDGEHVEVAISDTGVGIPDEVRDHIYEPFFTTKDVGRGTGQGLAIARQIVVSGHGGELRFDSVPGQGTTFYIRLPLRPAPRNQPAGAVATEET